MKIKLDLLCKFKTEKITPFHYSIGRTPLAVKPFLVCNFSDDVSKFVRLEFSKINYNSTERLDGVVYINNDIQRKVERLSLQAEFSPDSQHIAYPTASAFATSKEGNQSVLLPKFSYSMIFDDQIFENFSGILHNAVFDENSNDWAFSAQTSMMDVAISAFLPGFQSNNIASDLKQFVIFNGVKQKEYLKIIGYPKFSKKGSAMGYTAATGKINKIIDGSIGMDPSSAQKMHELMYKDAKMVAVINNTEGEVFDDIYGDIAFNADGSQYAYAARNGNDFFIILNGEKLERYDQVSMPTFLSNNKLAHYAYNKKRSKHFVVIDGEAQKEYDAFGARGIITNEDGNYAYTAKLNNKWTVVFNGNEMGFHSNIQKNSPVLSEEGNTVAFGFYDDFKFKMQVNDRIDNIEFKQISKPWLNNDGSRYAYTGIIGEQHYIVIDGVKFGPFHDALPRFYFSPDNKNVAYFIEQPTKPQSSKFP
ncbi:MAG TPA: hypothetical protein VMX55_10235, partial [candidate division Zixibacteria bacterium]|nr:hypothetical protein [candidate division Zixibacteria bacterium]